MAFIAGLTAAAPAYGIARHDHGKAKEKFIRASKAESEIAAGAVKAGPGEFHLKPRTLSPLPGVRDISRHAKSVTPDVMATCHQT